MTGSSAQRLRKMAVVTAGLTVAALSFGATEPAYPDLGRGDQAADIGRCPTETIDGVTVCTRSEPVGVAMTVTTVATGLTIVD